MAGDSALEIRVTIGRGFVDLELTGDLDMASAGNLRRLLHRLDRIDVRVLCHLRNVGFIDSTGLQVLVESARHRGGVHPAASLHVCDASRPVRRLLDLVGSHGTNVDAAAWDRFFASDPPARSASPGVGASNPAEVRVGPQASAGEWLVS